MKKLLLAFITFLSLNSQGQIWCTPGSVWNFKEIFLGGNGCKRMEYLYDTIINGKTCNKIKEVRIGKNYTTPLIDYMYTRYFYTHIDNNVVYLDNDTLYNFNANIGDKWRIAPVNHSLCTGSYVTVLDTGHVLIQGQNLKSYSVTSTTFYPNTSWAVYGNVYERIGAIDVYPYHRGNVCDYGSDQGIGGPLYTFSDSQIADFKYVDWYSCQNIVSIKELKESEAPYRFYPNPTQGQLYFNYRKAHGENVSLIITDLFGRELKHIYLAPENEEHFVDLSSLRDGIYLLSVFRDQAIIYTEKLIKQE